MQKFKAWRNRPLETQRRRCTISSCMIAICPAGPPKLMNPSFTQKRAASRNVTPCCGVSSLTERSVGGSDEERYRSVAHLGDRRGGADRSLEAVEQVLVLEPQQVHGHLTRDQPNPEV